MDIPYPIDTGGYIPPRFPTPSSTVAAAFVADVYYTLPPDLQAETMQFDFAGAELLDIDPLTPVMQSVAGILAGEGQTLIAWVLFKDPIFSIDVPGQLCIPWTSLCWIPPWAGQTIITGYNYRLWMLWAQVPAANALPQAYPQVMALAVGPILAIGAIIAFDLLAVVIAYQIRVGKANISDIRALTPGGQFDWVPWAFAAAGVAMVAAGIFIPMAQAGVSATVPIGGAEIGGGFGAGGGAGGGGGRRRR